MRTWVASRLWIWLPRIGQVVAVVGGIAMLLAAAMIHQTQVVPSAVIGALWLALAFRGIGQMKASAWTVSIDGEAVMFRGRREVLIPAKDIVEIRRSRGDLN